MDEVNRNRLEGFRQLRREIRHSEEYLIVGMDIAKDRHRTMAVNSRISFFYIFHGYTPFYLSGVSPIHPLLFSSRSGS